jgi:hypothetical protein
MKQVSSHFMFSWLLISTLGCGPTVATEVPAAPGSHAVVSGDRPAPSTLLRFEVSVAQGLIAAPHDGRLLVVLGKTAQPEPRLAIGSTGMNTAPVLGVDLNGLTVGVVGIVDERAEVFPIERLSRLPPGEYYAQALFDSGYELNLRNAPGNLYSKPQRVFIDPARGETIKLELSQQVPAEQLPSDTDYVKFVKLPSNLLSKFHGRPMFLRAAVILPRDYEKEANRRYPLRVHIGGYGTRFTRVRATMEDGAAFRNTWLADDTPRMIYLQLDGAGPYGDPYQVNSDNNGPYGAAITQELIPYIEKTYRSVRQPQARFLDGASTGGWVSLALQVFYPDFFNGAWSQCPDPVDFRAYELVNIYSDDNVYVNRHGFERPSKREISGDIEFTLRHECQIENVMGRGNLWSRSGKDWCAWNAVFGPRGPDGLPVPLWGPKSGKIDRSVLDHWKKYDLRLVLEQNWNTLGPKLRGKIHIWVGDADDYFLNNAVHLLDAFLKKADPPYEGRIEFAARQGHTIGWDEKRIMDEMAAALERTH